MTTRILWSETRTQHVRFTGKMIKWWFAQHGGRNLTLEDTGERPDFVGVSLNAFREASNLTTARRLADKWKVPLIMGGTEAYTGATYLAWADYICLGEGYNLLRALAQTSKPLEVLEAAPNVLKRSDPMAEIVPDYFVPWAELPPFQTDKREWYYLYGRGCQRKCRFCNTAWVQPHQVVKPGIYKGALAQIPAKHRIYCVSNEFGLGTQAGSMTVAQFLEGERPRGDWPKCIRLGVEGLTEERRRWLGKPIPDRDIVAAIDKALRIRKILDMLYIIGFPDDPPADKAAEILTSQIPLEPRRQPMVYTKVTWFEAAPHTPLAKWDLRQLTPWDSELWFDRLRARSGRFRPFRPGKIGQAVWSVVLRRLLPEQAKEWARMQDKIKAMTVQQGNALAEQLYGRAVVDGSGSYPWERIKVRIKLGENAAG